MLTVDKFLPEIFHLHLIIILFAFVFKTKIGIKFEAHIFCFRYEFFYIAAILQKKFVVESFIVIIRCYNLFIQNFVITILKCFCLDENYRLI